VNGAAEREEPKAEVLERSATGVEGATAAAWPKGAPLPNLELPEKGLADKGCAGAEPKAKGAAESDGAEGFCSGSSEAWRFFFRLSSSSAGALAELEPKDPKGFSWGFALLWKEGRLGLASFVAVAFSPSEAFEAPKPVNDFPASEKEGAAGAATAVETASRAVDRPSGRAPKAGVAIAEPKPVLEGAGADFARGAAPNENPVEEDEAGAGAGADRDDPNESPFGAGVGWDGAELGADPNESPEAGAGGGAAAGAPNENPVANGFVAGGGAISDTALTGAAAVRGLVPNEIAEGAGEAEPKDSAAVVVEDVFAGFDEPNEAPEEGALPKENPEGVATGALVDRAAGAGTGSPEESLLSQATHRWAALSLKTRQTGHLRELGRLTRESGSPSPEEGASVLGSLDSQATHLEAVLSLKTMQTEHFTLLGRLTRESGRPVEDNELEVRGAAATEDLVLSVATALSLEPPGVGGYFFDTFLAGGEKMNRTLLAEEASEWEELTASSSNPSMSVGALKVNSSWSESLGREKLAGVCGGGVSRRGLLREEAGGLREGAARPLSRLQSGSAASTLLLPEKALGVVREDEGLASKLIALGVAMRSLIEGPAAEGGFAWGVDSRNLTLLEGNAEVACPEGLAVRGFLLCSSKVAVISPRVSRMRFATTPLADDLPEIWASSLAVWKVVLRLISRLCTLEMAAVWLLWESDWCCTCNERGRECWAVTAARWIGSTERGGEVNADLVGCEGRGVTSECLRGAIQSLSGSESGPKDIFERENLKGG
jgi:hypothetical protein